MSRRLQKIFVRLSFASAAVQDRLGKFAERIARAVRRQPLYFRVRPQGDYRLRLTTGIQAAPPLQKRSFAFENWPEIIGTLDDWGS